jgi:hypothetical protein
MRVLVCGGRDFDDSPLIFAELDRLHALHRFATLIEGAARGVDTIAGEWARSRGVELVEYPAKWEAEGRHAALIRNERMLREGKPDLVVAFPGKRGTFHMCLLATKAGLPIVKLYVADVPGSGGGRPISAP